MKYVVSGPLVRLRIEMEEKETRLRSFEENEKNKRRWRNGGEGKNMKMTKGKKHELDLRMKICLEIYRMGKKALLLRSPKNI